MTPIHPPALRSPYDYPEQPSPEHVLIDDKHALMRRAHFERLLEYSSTTPTGAYIGKMWRRHDGNFQLAAWKRGEMRGPKPPDPIWLFCWFGQAADPSKVTINYREVLLV